LKRKLPILPQWSKRRFPPERIIEKSFPVNSVQASGRTTKGRFKEETGVKCPSQIFTEMDGARDVQLDIRFQSRNREVKCLPRSVIAT
jgi:hypothetical protein